MANVEVRGNRWHRRLVGVDDGDGDVDGEADEEEHASAHGEEDEARVRAQLLQRRRGVALVRRPTHHGALRTAHNVTTWERKQAPSRARGAAAAGGRERVWGGGMWVRGAAFQAARAGHTYVSRGVACSTTVLAASTSCFRQQLQGE